MNKFFIIIIFFSLNVKAQEFPSVEIATGSVSGIYYPAGGAICQVLRRSLSIEDCFIKSTSGTKDNIKLLSEGKANLAIIQADSQFNNKDILNKKQIDSESEIKALFGLHTDLFLILVRADSKIKNLNDIKGKIVNIGTSGSGVRYFLEYIMKLKDWKYSDFTKITELKNSEQAEALCNNLIDVAFYALGSPNQEIKYATSSCHSKLISLNNSEIETSIKKDNIYTPKQIRGGLYKGNHSDINTFGVQSLLVTNDKHEEDFIYNIVKSFFYNIEYFKNQHPIFRNLVPENMIQTGSVPLHDGAIKYYKEVGWIR